MYISFSGVQGCGKSTLVDILYKQLKNKYNNKKILKFNSITRKLLSKLNVNLYELRKNKEGLKIWQYFALNEYFNKLEEVSGKYDIILMDRAYIDFLIYTDIFIGNEYTNKLKLLFERKIEKYNSNSIKFYVNPLNNIDNISDGVRDISSYDVEVEVFEQYKHLFDYIIINNDINKRISEINNYLVTYNMW